MVFVIYFDNVFDAYLLSIDKYNIMSNTIEMMVIVLC
jgi:hypothetical protein